MLGIDYESGNLRSQIPNILHYIGMDPIPLAEATKFDFICGLTEYSLLPERRVRHITVISAIDYFLDCQYFLREVTRVLEPNG